jgi:hypothetical protein
MFRNKKTTLLVLAVVLALMVDVANADFTFGEPVNLKEVIPVIDPDYECIDCLSYDGLEIYIQSFRSGGYGGIDLWRLTRDSVNEDWGPLENLGPTVNSSRLDAWSAFSPDGLTLYFVSNRPGGHGRNDIYMTKRVTRNDPWGEPINLGQLINSSERETSPYITADGLELYFDSDRPGGYGSWDMWVARRDTIDDDWGEPENLGPTVNSASSEGNQCISADGLVLCFGSNRPGGYGGNDMWMARRASVSSPWEPPVNLGPKVNSPANEGFPQISPDGSTLYFTTNSNGIWDNWQAPIEPVVDLNGDGIVDSADMCIIVDNWGTDEPLCDIGPMPWGDGIVDVQDLIVLAEHLFEETALIE